MKNYYDILEIHHDSGQEVISASYKSLYKHFDPANFKTPEEKLQAKIRRNQLDEAYKILSNPAKKAKYDRYFRRTGGNVEIKRSPGEIILMLIALSLIIIVISKFLADYFFKYFAKLTVLIATTPALTLVLAFIIIAIIIHLVWKNLRKR